MNDMKKLIEEARKKFRSEAPEGSGGSQDPTALHQSIIQMAGSSGVKRDKNNLLIMMSVGGARPKIRHDKSNSPCFAC